MANRQTSASLRFNFPMEGIVKIKVLLAATAACVGFSAAFGIAPIAAYEAIGQDGQECAVLAYSNNRFAALEDRSDCGRFLAVVPAVYSQTLPLYLPDDDGQASNTIWLVVEPENDRYEPIGYRFTGPERVWMGQTEFFEDGSARFYIGTVGNQTTITLWRAHPFTVSVEIEPVHGQEYDY